MKFEYSALVEKYGEGKTEVIWEKSVPVPFCPPRIPRRMDCGRTPASVATGRRQTAQVKARPNLFQ